eukprot:TRINITY_DN9210_c0_g1_i1.p1 TRINITY_DN9210_c0_g1~~TRINITY_DN9210_c0_g1_i1.p1  ORF type:complete len:829 (-),score=168.41 TRINITY_DN9210_c0_g1_i1:45-2531(-)
MMNHVGDSISAPYVYNTNEKNASIVNTENKDQPLGVIGTEIIDTNEYPSNVVPGTSASLVFDPYNVGFVYVHNSFQERVGRIPNHIARWLGLLISNHRIYATCDIPNYRTSKESVLITVYPFSYTPEEQKLMTPEEMQSFRLLAEKINLSYENVMNRLSLPKNSRKRSSSRISVKINLPSKRAKFISNTSLSNLIDDIQYTSDMKEAEPAPELNLSLRYYQKQALYWMINRENCIDHDSSLKLPSHWQELESSLGKKYYFNTQTNQTTWVFPFRAVAEDSDHLNKVQVRGGILADQMGMGKTIEMLSLMLTNRFNHDTDEMPQFSEEGLVNTRASLVVCPLSLIHQWESEIKNHSTPGSMKVNIYHGCNRIREPSKIADFDVVLTTYATLAAELSSKKPGGLLKLHWYRIILDEAHTIKDRSTRNAKAAFSLSAERRWAVTGTPIQNKLDDLFSLFHFLRVDPYGDIEWWNNIILKPIKSRDEKGFIRLQTILQDILIRRTKDQLGSDNSPILSLPPRVVNIVEHTFTPQERQIYNELWNSSKQKFNELSEKVGGILNNYAHVLEILLRLRQVCNHPQLAESAVCQMECLVCMNVLNNPVKTKCEHVYCSSCIQNFICEDGITYMCPLCKVSLAPRDFSPIPQDVAKSMTSTSSLPSTKINALMYEIHNLEQNHPDEKSIVFSQWTSMLDLIENSLAESGVRFVRLDGTMSQANREKSIKLFNTDPTVKIFLISMKAGGLGLNLTAGSRVFLMDPWWNPATEEQAIDRVHRIGQTRPVIVTRFIIKETVEERILALQERKRQLASNALALKASELKEIRLEELKLLFR